MLCWLRSKGWLSLCPAFCFLSLQASKAGFRTFGLAESGRLPPPSLQLFNAKPEAPLRRQTSAPVPHLLYMLGLPVALPLLRPTF